MKEILWSSAVILLFMASHLVSVVRKVPNSDAPLVIVLHGYGANEQDLLPIAYSLGASNHICSFRAPYIIGQNQFAWFNLIPEGEDFSYDLGEIEKSLTSLKDSFQLTLSQQQLAPSKVIVLGFSQGGGMALAATIRGFIPATQVIALSALWIEGLELETVDHPFTAIKIHGTQDPLIPIETSRNDFGKLVALGIPTKYEEFLMGHEISAEALRAILTWLHPA